MGLLIVDKQTGRIHSHRVQAVGNVPPLTLETCFPPWERATIRERYEAYETSFSYSTQEAKDNLRVINGQVHYKPVVALGGETKVKEGEPCSLAITVTDTLPGEELTEIRIKVGGVEQSIPLVDNQAVVPLIFELAGEYKVSVADDRFRPVPAVTVEVLEVIE